MRPRSIDESQMLDDFERLCRTKGLRITHQRVEIYKVLLRHANHPTVEDVYAQVRRHLKTISLDTVYRTIATFVEHDLVQRVHHIDNATRLDINTANHHHLACSRCQRIEDFYWPEFDQLKPPKSIAHWHRTKVKRVVISGVCASCREGK
jgi:Fur family peroxide stress response transcriptional regulator